MTLSQLSLQTGVLAPAIATSMAFDPIASVILGTTLLQESLHTTTAGAVAALAALAAALGGLAVLARAQQQAGRQGQRRRRRDGARRPRPRPAPSAPCVRGFA